MNKLRISPNFLCVEMKLLQKSLQPLSQEEAWEWERQSGHYFSQAHSKLRLEVFGTLEKEPGLLKVKAVLSLFGTIFKGIWGLNNKQITKLDSSREDKIK